MAGRTGGVDRAPQDGGGLSRWSRPWSQRNLAGGARHRLLRGVICFFRARLCESATPASFLLVIPGRFLLGGSYLVLRTRVEEL